MCYNGEVPLHIADRRGYARIVKLLLQHNADPNRLSRDRHTPLVASLFGSSLECFQALIQVQLLVPLELLLAPKDFLLIRQN
ncbi:unnamed protein product [Urochloa humidicola]